MPKASGAAAVPLILACICVPGALQGKQRCSWGSSVPGEDGVTQEGFLQDRAALV